MKIEVGRFIIEAKAQPSVSFGFEASLLYWPRYTFASERAIECVLQLGIVIFESTIYIRRRPTP